MKLFFIPKKSYLSKYLHTSRNSVSPLCVILFLVLCQQAMKGLQYWAGIYIYIYRYIKRCLFCIGQEIQCLLCAGFVFIYPIALHYIILKSIWGKYLKESFFCILESKQSLVSKMHCKNSANQPMYLLKWTFKDCGHNIQQSKKILI